ncbi:MAG: hypothetical protein KJO64_02800 [Bacteroidia bacterium]|nr:hypothetical protein [Bacteroidia bacterium]NNC86310.1 hypothetical protein [Bacteroidia bacterium]
MENPIENTENSHDAYSNSKNLTLSNAALTYIKESANWSQFLAILGFIAVAFMVIFAVIMFFAFSSIPGDLGDLPIPSSLFSILYLLLAVLYFFPVWYLYNYSSGVKDAITMNDSAALEEGLKNLKSHHKFMGIMTIIIIGFYILGFLMAILFAGSF